MSRLWFRIKCTLWKKIDWKETKNSYVRMFLFEVACLKLDYKRDCNGLDPKKKKSYVDNSKYDEEGWFVDEIP